MTAREWDTDQRPEQLLWAVQGRPSYRKLRLLACACCRRLWDVLASDADRARVASTEQYADGLISESEYLAAFPTDPDSRDYLPARPDVQAKYFLALALHTLGWPDAEQEKWDIDEITGEQFPEPWDPGEYAQNQIRNLLARLALAVNWGVRDGKVDLESRRREESAQAELIRDVLGNPFRPIAFSPEWRTDTAMALAQQMYESHEFSAMPILADALQDAGCNNDEILDHCRNTNQPHARGCWVNDLVLGRH
jgi:hypothetical protein